MEVLLAYAFVFILAVFLGWELIRKVPARLHTPLMSGSNAISGIAIVGAMLLVASPGADPISLVLSTAAVTFAAINVVGGYAVTGRMLAMFKSRAPEKASDKPRTNNQTAGS